MNISMNWDQFVSNTIDKFLSFDDDKVTMDMFKTPFGEIALSISCFGITLVFHPLMDKWIYGSELEECFSKDVVDDLKLKKVRVNDKEVFTQIINELKNDFMNQFEEDLKILTSKGFELLGFGVFKLKDFTLKIQYHRTSNKDPIECKNIYLLKEGISSGWNYSSLDELFSNPPMELFACLNQETRDGMINGQG